MRPALFLALLLSAAAAVAGPDQPWREASGGGGGGSLSALLSAACGAALGYCASVLRHGRGADHSAWTVIGGAVGLILSPFIGSL